MVSQQLVEMRQHPATHDERYLRPSKILYVQAFSIRRLETFQERGFSLEYTGWICGPLIREDLKIQLAYP